MKVLLTGGAGFVGSHVADQLLARGHEVAVVDDLSSGKKENIPDGTMFYEQDIRDGCAEIFEEFEPDALCHQAAQMDVRRSVKAPDFASTGGAVYGEQREFPAPEDHPQYPISPYGVSKLAGERYLHFYNTQYGLPYAALRYANVYGPRQDPHGEAGVVAIFCGNLAAGRGSTINGSGEQTRDYVYVEDVARANVLALEGNAPSGAYNVGTGIETSVNELYEILRETSGRDLLPTHVAAKPGEQLRSSVDPTAAARVLGWRPVTDLVTGLERTLRFFKTIGS
jgi:UDP-glucose 4-epimerase